MKKPHKFFERYLGNDLDLLSTKMMLLRENLLDGKIGNIPTETLDRYQAERTSINSEVTGLAGHYNIFALGYEEMDVLKEAIRESVIEAHSYYETGEDITSLNYQLRGWLNVNYGSVQNQGMERSAKFNARENFHEHNDGKGMPDLHGYYCVNAEPSITHYLINKTDMFENHNINNRMILSETGHPHRADMWEYDSPRITIAYDACPRQHQDDNISIPLW